MDEKKFIIDILNSQPLHCTSIDWNKLIVFANKHALWGSLYKHTMQNKYVIPITIKQQLNNFYLDNVKRNMVLFNELKKILKVCGKNVVVLKGFSIIFSTNQDIGERFFVDIDLLALKKLKFIVENIKKLGYSEKKDYSEEIYKKHFHHYNVLIKELGVNVAVEVHHQISKITAPFKIFINDLELRRLSFLKANMNILSPEDLLIHICTHAAYDNLFVSGIRDMLDIRYLVENNKISWSKIVEKSKRWNCSSFVYSALNLSKDVLKTKIPNNVLNKIKINGYNHQLFILKYIRKNLFKSTIFQLNKWFFKLLLARNVKERVVIITNGFMFLLEKFHRHK